MKINSVAKLTSVLAISALFTACASLKPERGPGVFDVSGQGGVLGTTATSVKPISNEGDEPLGGEIAGVKLDVTQFDIPVTKNSRVEFWVRYFSGRGRNLFADYIERLGKMWPLMVPKLKEAGLPQDLVYLAMIESGFSTTARSWAGAVGPWQFMKGTSRLYGLKTDVWVDERRDPVKSTDAAIRYLARLYEEFKDWQLAAAAYNAGEGRIRKGIARYNTQDYWELARHRAIRPETVDYVPKMMAAAIITKNAKAFGFVPHEIDHAWMETQMVTLDFPEDLYSIARVAGTSQQELRQLNPELVHWTTPPQKGYQLRVPNAAAKTQLLAAIENGELGKYRGFKRYIVRRGDTISRVASNFGVGIQPVMVLNNLSSARGLKPGQALLLPIPRDMQPVLRVASAPRRTSRESNVRVASSARSSDSRARVAYTVREGDTLYDISRRFDVSVQQLRQWNPSSGPKTLRPGRVLRLYVSNDRNSI